MEVDASHFLNVYDVDLIYSWTPREFKNFIKGSKLRKIDSYELSAASAIFNAKVKGKKHVKLKDIYDSEKAIKKMNELASGKAKAGLSLDLYRRAKESMKGYSPSMK